MYGRPQQGDANLAQSIRYLNDRISKLEAGVGGARIIENVSLVAGENTIPHGLGRKPSSWWAAAPNGAFPSGGAGGGGGIYPNITPPRASASQVNSVAYTASHTMQFVPADGAILIACPSINSAPTAPITALTQIGVTWTQLDGTAYDINSNKPQLWVGQCSSGATTSVGVSHTGGASSYPSSLTVVEIPEIASTTPTANGSYKFPIVSFPDVRPYDTSTQFGTPPVPNAGDIVVTVAHADAPYLPNSSGWDCVAACFAFGTAYNDTLMFAKVAQQAEHQPFRSVANLFSADAVVYQACFPSNLSAVSGGGGTTPHGFREVSSDNTNLVIDSVSDVTIDLIVR